MARVLAVCAHQDDETIGAGISLYRHTKSGDRVRLVVVSDGGGSCEGIDRESLTKTRNNCTIAAMGMIGIKKDDIIFLGLRDMELNSQKEIVTACLLEILRTYRPDIVYIHAREGGHRDHDAVHLAFVPALKNYHAGKPAVYEYAEYNDYYRKNRRGLGFITRSQNYEIRIKPVHEEITVKKRMLEQYYTEDLSVFYSKPEVIRLFTEYKHDRFANNIFFFYRLGIFIRKSLINFIKKIY